MPHYLDKKDLAKEITHYKATGELTEALYRMLTDMAEGLAKKVGAWSQAQAAGWDCEEAVAEMWPYMLPRLNRIKPDANPFSFITTCILNFYRHQLRSMLTASDLSGLHLGAIENGDDLCTEAVQSTHYKRYPEPQAKKIGKQWYITYRGETKTLTAWAKELGIKYSTLHSRLKRNKMTVKHAMYPKRHACNRIECDDGEILNLKEYCERIGITYYTGKGRLRAGKPLDRPQRIIRVSQDQPLTIANETKTLIEWATANGIKWKTAAARIRQRGWPIEKAVTMPTK